MPKTDQNHFETINSTLQSLTRELKILSERQEAFNGMRNDLADFRQDVTRDLNAINMEVKQASAAISSQGEKLTRVERRLEVDDKRMARLEERQIYEEARARRCNLVFLGVLEESKEDTKSKVQDIIKKLTPSKITIMTARRIGKLAVGSKARPRPIIVEFSDVNDKASVKAQRSNLPTGIQVKDDLPIEIREARKELNPLVAKFKEDPRNKVWVSFPAKLFVNDELRYSVRPMMKPLDDQPPQPPARPIPSVHAQAAATPGASRPTRPIATADSDEVQMKSLESPV